MTLPDMNYDQWRLWVEILHMAGTAGLAFYVWLSNRHRVTMSKIEALEGNTRERLDRHKTKITCLETDVKYIPTQDDIKELNARIDRVNGVLQRVDGRLEGINRAVDLMNEHLLNRSHL